MTGLVSLDHRDPIPDPTPVPGYRFLTVRGSGPGNFRPEVSRASVTIAATTCFWVLGLNKPNKGKRVRVIGLIRASETGRSSCSIFLCSGHPLNNENGKNKSEIGKTHQLTFDLT